MNQKRYLLFFVFAFYFVFAVVPVTVYAYVDPGTGSYVFQLILAFFLGGFLGVKVFWRKIKSFFTAFFFRTKKKKTDE